MARRKSTSPPEEEFEEQITDVEVGDEMRSSFLEYAYSVIYLRALPDARDGLKPVQRRILYTMAEMGLRPDRGHVKCGRVVGEVMGKLHPHSDAPIYDALVRLAQSWVMRVPTVDGHGNFGNLDDGPAQMRYTECRMTPAALSMTASLDEDVVDFKLNYDGREQEPVVLPSAFPNLLVNGAAGIAVGMATNMPPHNLVEVIQALRHLLDHPNASLDELMKYLPGPDLPTGGKVIGLDGIRDAYETGRGAFKMRATTRIENVTPRRKGIVVTELPYNVGPERVIERTKTLVQNKKLQGIADLKDLTDREHGLRLVIEVKNGFNPEAILEQMFKLTPMEESFNINNVALVEGQPRTMGLKDLLEVYLEHRIDVTRRRTQFRLNKAQERLHLVQGLLIAILDIDEVIALIRASDDAGEAKASLIARFDLSEVQAQYILDLQLRRLTKFSKLELEREQEQLEQTIRDLTATLESEKLLRRVVSGELKQIAKEHGEARRTVLLESSGVTAASAVPLEVPDDPCRVLLSCTGLLARTSGDEIPGDGGDRVKHDAIASVVRTTARGQVGLVTSHGRLIRASVLDMPALPSTANRPNLQGGAPVAEFVSLQPGEHVLCLTTLDTESLGLALGTAQGVVKRVRPEHLSNRDEWEVIALADGDCVVGALELTSEDHDLVFVTSDAQLLRFGSAAVRAQGRSGGGVAGIKLTADATVIFFGAVDPTRDGVVVTVAGSDGALPGTDAGTVKVAAYSEYPAKGRATGGVRCHRFLRGEDRLLLAWAGAAPALASASSGAPIDLPEPDGKRDGSGVPVDQPIIAVAGPVA